MWMTGHFENVLICFFNVLDIDTLRSPLRPWQFHIGSLDLGKEFSDSRKQYLPWSSVKLAGYKRCRVEDKIEGWRTFSWWLYGNTPKSKERFGRLFHRRVFDVVLRPQPQTNHAVIWVWGHDKGKCLGYDIVVRQHHTASGNDISNDSLCTTRVIL